MTDLAPDGPRTAYADVGHEAFMARLEPHHTLEALRSVEAAYNFSKYGHHGEGHERYIARLMACPDWRVHAIKFADRLQNMRSLYACDKAKRDRKLAETRQMYLPLFAAMEGAAPPEHRVAVRSLTRSIVQIVAPA